jgi:hypothetical protein
MGIQKQLSFLFPFLGRRRGRSWSGGVVASVGESQGHTSRGPSSPHPLHRTRTRQSQNELKLLESIWIRLRWEYFPDRADLDTYQMEWSTRKQKRVLASCNIRNRRIRVARELLEPSAVRWLEAVVFHEMCHAVLGYDVSRAGGKRQWHGKEFRALEMLHPEIPALEQWIRSGGWHSAVRSNRARLAWQKRK